MSTSAGDSEKAQGTPLEVNFTLFLSTLGLQAYVALGELPDPASSTKSVNLAQAKYMIDLLGVIDGKTKGNLTPDEENTLSGMLYELRLKYMEKLKGGPNPAASSQTGA